MSQKKLTDICCVLVICFFLSFSNHRRNFTLHYSRFTCFRKVFNLVFFLVVVFSLPHFSSSFSCLCFLEFSSFLAVGGRVHGGR